jgi:hypothetical protein
VLVSVTIKLTVVDAPPETWTVLLSVVAPLILRVTEVDPVIPVLVSWTETVMELPGHGSLGFIIKLLTPIAGTVADGDALGLEDAVGRGDGEGEDEGIGD